MWVLYRANNRFQLETRENGVKSFLAQLSVANFHRPDCPGRKVRGLNLISQGQRASLQPRLRGYRTEQNIHGSNWSVGVVDTLLNVVRTLQYYYDVNHEVNFTVQFIGYNEDVKKA